MKTTVIGLIASPDGLAVNATGAWASPATEYRSRQARHIPVDVGHSHQWVGQVVHLEHGAGGVWCVAELDVSEPALIVRVGNQDVPLREPTFFSAELDGTLDGRDLKLLSVAVCHRTARLGARPLTWYDGGLDRRSGWHTDTVQRQLLERASETRTTRHGRPLVIQRSNQQQTAHRLGGGGGWIDSDGEPVPTSHRHDPRPSGPMMVRPSRITAVR